MDTLFNENPINNEKILAPLAERVRPATIDEFVGQQHLLGEEGVLRKLILNNKLSSMILWGDPGTGKTTLARVISNSIKSEFIALSALDSGIKELRESISRGERNFRSGKQTILFIDEIHRFNKSQQDGLLGAVEKGYVILIGATTENPSFEVNSALLSRTTVYKLNQLTNADIQQIIGRALEKDSLLSKLSVEFENIDGFINICSGDARKSLVYLETLISSFQHEEKIFLSDKRVSEILNKVILNYDKDGENHYDTISAFIKSMRGSDPDAAVYWLAKMLEGGEDPLFIARRMVVFASEDVGNSDPQAIQVAVSVFQACQLIGMPECRINLAQAATYLASTHKSNASYMAIEEALSEVRKGSNINIPMHLRNAPTSLMKKMDYGKGYKYPHHFENNFVLEQYLPDSVKDKVFYQPSNNGMEVKLKGRLDNLWQGTKKK